MPAATRVLPCVARGGDPRHVLDLADRAQLQGSLAQIILPALDEDGRLDVVTARGIGQQVVDHIASRGAPQVMMGVDDGKVGLEDLLVRRQRQPRGARRKDPAKGGRFALGHGRWLPVQRNARADLQGPCTVEGARRRRQGRDYAGVLAARRGEATAWLCRIVLPLGDLCGRGRRPAHPSLWASLGLGRNERLFRARRRR
jgi:hypothetical protein